MTGSTAILYFARTPGNDLKAGHFDNGRLHKNLISGLNRKSKQAIRTSGIPSVLINEHLQQGETFAERLTHAIQTVFEKGFHNVIAIGNDCPELSSDHLVQAKHLLESGTNVLGPALDGGDYLIGIRKSSFLPEMFCGSFAQKEEVHERLMFTLSDAGMQPAELEILSDIDDSVALLLWLNNQRPSAKNKGFILFLLDLLSEKIFRIFLPSLPSMRFAPYQMPHRGPPKLNH